MGEFFRGWRRKAGLVTLAMACLLATGWMRSYVAPSPPFSSWFESRDGVLFLWNDILIEGVAWSGPRGALVFISYWSLVLPLTLLSVWLILSKPWPAKSVKESNRG